MNKEKKAMLLASLNESQLQSLRQQLNTANARISQLESVLLEVARGELLDDIGNHNDNGMQDFQNFPASGKQIAAWLHKIEAVLKDYK